MIWGIRSNVVRVAPNRIRFVRYRFRLTRRQSVRDIFGLMQHAPDLRPVLAAAALPKFVAVGEHDLWPLALHRRFAQAIGAKIAVYRGGHSPSETSPHQMSRDLIALYRRRRGRTPPGRLSAGARVPSADGGGAGRSGGSDPNSTANVVHAIDSRRPTACRLSNGRAETPTRSAGSQITVTSGGIW